VPEHYPLLRAMQFALDYADTYPEMPTGELDGSNGGNQRSGSSRTLRL
jgi:hypothetical protein